MLVADAECCRFPQASAFSGVDFLTFKFTKCRLLGTVHNLVINLLFFYPRILSLFAVFVRTSNANAKQERAVLGSLAPRNELRSRTLTGLEIGRC